MMVIDLFSRIDFTVLTNDDFLVTLNDVIERILQNHILNNSSKNKIFDELYLNVNCLILHPMQWKCTLLILMAITPLFPFQLSINVG